MRTERITLGTPDGAMPAYVAFAEQAKGAVIVVQEAFGITSHIEDVTRRFAQAGFTAIAPAYFHREGSPVLRYDELSRAMPLIKKMTGEGLLADSDAAIGWLEKQGFSGKRIGIVGFCMGGSVALSVGARRPLGAAVSFYGGGIVDRRWEDLPPLVALAKELKAPWQGHYGDQDKGIPVEQVEQLRRAASGASVPTELFRYPEAGHGFHCDERPQAFHPASAKLAFERTVAFFTTHLKA